VLNVSDDEGDPQSQTQVLWSLDEALRGVIR